MAALAAALGAAAGFALGSGRDGGAPPAPAEAAPQVSAPSSESGGDAERARLEAENRRLRGVVEALEAQVEMLARAEAEAPSDGEEAQEPEDDTGFDAAALEAAGWLPADVERLRKRFEAYELDRLYLRNQAAREGWRGTARFMREMRGLRAELRAELGDEDFDAALYGAGRNNRVAVQGLLDDSAAQAAGLRPGDEILRYAGERIFDAFALVRLTARGEAGKPVELRVIRDGEELRFFLPRGPLGVRLAPASRPPA